MAGHMDEKPELSIVVTVLQRGGDGRRAVRADRRRASNGRARSSSSSSTTARPTTRSTRLRAPARRATRACAPSASRATSASTRRCTPASRARAATSSSRWTATCRTSRRTSRSSSPRSRPAPTSRAAGAAARRDSWGRTLPSRLINGMLRRFTGVAHLRLRLRLQRVPAPRRRADARLDRQAEVHEGARPLGRRVRRRGGRRPRRAARPVPLLAAPPDARSRCTCSPASGRSRSSGSAWLGHRSARSLATALGIYGVVFWITKSNFPGRSSAASLHRLRPRVQGFILALVGEYLGRIQRQVEGRPLYTIDGGALSRSEFSSPAAPGSSRRTSSATCSRRRRTRSSRSTR